MNATFAASCRVKQAVFRIRRRMRPVREPSVTDGGGAIWSAAQILRANRLFQPLLVIGRDAGPWGARLKQTLEEGDLALSLWDASECPTLDEAEALCSRWLAEGCDCFLAVGGADTLGLAKLAAARAARRGRPLADMEGYGRVGRKTPPVLVVPVGTGSGVETLAWADAADAAGRRIRIEDPALTPAIAILDPSLQDDIPRRTVARSVFDGLCLAVEAYLSRCSDDRARDAAAEAVKAFFEAAEPCWNAGGTAQQRTRLLEASRLAGFAASVGGFGYVRALADAASDAADIPREHALAVLLPLVLEKYGSFAGAELSSLAKTAGLGDGGAPSRRAEALIERIRSLAFRMGLPDTLDGVDGDTAARIADMAAAAANPYCACPVVWDADELSRALRAALTKPAS